MEKLVVFSMWMVGCVYGAMASDEITGKVVSVIDGNTLEVVGADHQKHKITLVGIDSPELLQDFGEKAKNFLENRLVATSVFLDSYPPRLLPAKQKELILYRQFCPPAFRKIVAANVVMQSRAAKTVRSFFACQLNCAAL